MTSMRLTTLTSTNRARPGPGINFGDVVQFTTSAGIRREGMVTSDQPSRDRDGISWIAVVDKHGRPHGAEFADCVRVNPPIPPAHDRYGS